jgi:uncharacterized membrane protein YidH (DUF202 family)
MEAASEKPLIASDMTAVYSPGQCAFACFLGGPLASIWCIRRNFQALGRRDAVRQTSLYGTLAMVLMFLVLPFLPDSFPNYLIALVTIAASMILVQRYQFTRQAISESESLTPHSNWMVAGIGLLAMVITLAAFQAFVMALHQLGVALG